MDGRAGMGVRGNTCADAAASSEMLRGGGSASWLEASRLEMCAAAEGKGKR